MNCASCALNVEKSLKQPGRCRRSSGEPEHRRSRYKLRSEKLNLRELENAVEKAGYGVVNEKVTIKVGGMSCAMCVKP